ncbi:hypothetical protein [Hymenobacter sp. AT01-02]|uniref:hypothetical protein n=1 Tax=Hymenobacter sp. AT01-02 TaxID=1571877 RepID=UPI0005F12825|nr:hypothetical protein [Hymenobacter sp. AT01-02]
MEFSRDFFYQLRDVAALTNGSRTHLRYSKSALELQYEYHTKKAVKISLRERLLLPMVLVVFAVLASQLTWADTGFVTWCIGIAIVYTLGAFRSTVHRFLPAGVINVTYEAGGAAFHFETVVPLDGPPPSIGPMLALADIQAVRVRTISDGGEHDPVYGVVDIRRAVTAPWVLFAELPTPAAAWELERALVQLVGPLATIPNTSAAAWLGKASRVVARIYQQLPHVRVRFR